MSVEENWEEMSNENNEVFGGNKLATSGTGEAKRNRSFEGCLFWANCEPWKVASIGNECNEQIGRF